MNSKTALSVVIILVALFVVIMAYIGDNPETVDNTGEEISFNVSSGPLDLSSFINATRTIEYYKNCDDNTIRWLESLGDMEVFFGNDTIVIMSPSEAKKIPAEPGITDVDIYNYFRAKVIENHSLGKEYATVYYVENVEFTGRDIVGNGLA